jgi:hypothetical protein
MGDFGEDEMGDFGEGGTGDILGEPSAFTSSSFLLHFSILDFTAVFLHDGLETKPLFVTRVAAGFLTLSPPVFILLVGAVALSVFFTDEATPVPPTFDFAD